MHWFIVFFTWRILPGIETAFEIPPNVDFTQMLTMVLEDLPRTPMDLWIYGPNVCPNVSAPWFASMEIRLEGMILTTRIGAGDGGSLGSNVADA